MSVRDTDRTTNPIASQIVDGLAVKVIHIPDYTILETCRRQNITLSIRNERIQMDMDDGFVQGRTQKSVRNDRLLAIFFCLKTWREGLD